ncbi:MAG: MFS transporter [Candidatus Nealsonbacteria bacterium]|nr:MFS transporter [Candidatus Nealsonbacteria bacterium]
MKPSKEIKILSLSFLFIFLGFAGVQQYLTSFFSEAGIAEVGFRSLILIYLFFILFNPLAAVFASKYGGKKSMLIGSIFYFIFIFFLLSKSPYLIYLISVFLGIGASLLWTGQNSFLIRASDEKSYGKNSGFFTSLQSFGSAVGVVLLGFLIGKFLFKLPILFFSFFPLMGFLLLFTLKDLKKEEKISNNFRLIKKSILSLTALRLASIYFAVQFIFGLVIGIIPIEIKNIFGAPCVGILSSLFYILPFLFSYYLGGLSDIIGRKKMIILSFFLIIVGLFSFIFSNHGFFLILGIILLAINSAIMRPVTAAFIGDISNSKNLEFITALFWMVQTIGVITALLISQLFIYEIKTIYLISIFVILISLVIILPLFRLKIEKIKEKLSQEIY